jgi:hypothetical protein
VTVRQAVLLGPSRRPLSAASATGNLWHEHCTHPTEVFVGRAAGDELTMGGTLRCWAWAR